MVKAKIDKETIAKVETLLKQVQDVKAGIKTVTVLTKKPELEISTELYSKDVSLNEVLKILFKNFSKYITQNSKVIKAIQIQMF